MECRKLFFVLFWTLSFWIGVSGQQLYPGDTNNNGKVDHIDLLYIGAAFGEVGVPRAVQDIFWQPYNFTDWGTNFPDTGLDYAYADCDGNGVIDEMDVVAIDFNYGQTHGAVTPNNFSQGITGIDPKLYFDSTVIVNSYPEGAIVGIPINLGSASLPIDDFYGISFSVEYDPVVFSFFGGPLGLIVAEDSWAVEADNVLQSVNFKDNDLFSGVLEVTIVRKDQTVAPQGFGEIGAFFGIIEENVVGIINPGGQEIETQLNIKDIRMVDMSGNTTAVTEDSVEVVIHENMFTSTDLLQNEQMRIFPNPAQDIIFVQSLGAEMEAIQLIDRVGKILYQSEISKPTKFIQIPTGDIPDGIYFAKLLTKTGHQVQKVAVKRE